MADRSKLKENAAQPFVKRGAFYGISLMVVAIAGTFGLITAEQAESIEDALPQILVLVFGTGSSLTALLNVHRGSDSRVSDEDYERVKNAAPPVEPPSLDDIRAIVQEERDNSPRYSEYRAPRHAAPDDTSTGYPG